MLNLWFDQLWFDQLYLATVFPQWLTGVSSPYVGQGCVICADTSLIVRSVWHSAVEVIGCVTVYWADKAVYTGSQDPSGVSWGFSFQMFPILSLKKIFPGIIRSSLLLCENPAEPHGYLEIYFNLTVYFFCDPDVKTLIFLFNTRA